MTNILMAVTGADHWTFADGSKHPSGYWPEEFATPYRIFTEAGFTVTIATPGAARPVPDQAGFTPEMNGGSAEVGESIRSYLDGIASVIDGTVALEDQNPADFAAVFIPGGHGPMEDLAVSRSFGDQLEKFTAAGKPVAAVCHGPAALLPARNSDGSWLFSGYRLTGFTLAEETQVGFAEKASWNLEPRLREEGAKFENAEPWNSCVIVDRNLLTGQNPASAEEIAQKLVATLKS